MKERMDGFERRIDDRFENVEKKLDNAIEVDAEDRKETHQRLTALETARAVSVGFIAAISTVYAVATDLFGLLAK